MSAIHSTNLSMMSIPKNRSRKKPTVDDSSDAPPTVKKSKKRQLASKKKLEPKKQQKKKKKSTPSMSRGVVDKRLLLCSRCRPRMSAVLKKGGELFVGHSVKNATSKKVAHKKKG